jgi:hypothetical protein
MMCKRQICSVILLVASAMAGGISGNADALSALQDTGVEGAVNAFIAREGKRSRCSEYKDARIIVLGNLDPNRCSNDGRSDVAVQYTLEDATGRSNNYTFYLAVFLNEGGKYVYKTHRQIGGKNDRDVTLKSIEGGKILVDTMGYLPNDPSCCPSQKGQTEFGLVDGKLKEFRKVSKAPGSGSGGGLSPVSPESGSGCETPRTGEFQRTRTKP